MKISGKKFSVKHAVFSVSEFMDLLNSGNLKRGDIIIFDEAGVGVASREWYSARNKAINYVLQTFRHLNLGVIFTTPDFSFVDAQTRKLFHSYIETQKINKRRKTVRVKWFELQNNPRMGKLYYKYPRVMGSGYHKIDRVHINKPSAGLIRAYEKKRKIFSKNLRDEIERDVMDSSQTEADIENRLNEIIAEVKDNYKDYLKVYNKREFINSELIRSKFNLSISKSKIVKAEVEKHIYK